MKIMLVILISFVVGCRQTSTSAPLYPELDRGSFPDISKKAESNDGSLFRDANFLADRRACKKGDIITVYINESHQVTQSEDVELNKSSQTKTSASTGNLSSVAKFLPMLHPAQALNNIEGERSTKSSGESDYDKRGSFITQMSVVVTDVSPNGLLVVWGKRKVAMDGEQKTISLSGLVDPDDITQDNTITSSKIAAASIRYEGSGTMTRNTDPGLGIQIFRYVLDALWPF